MSRFYLSIFSLLLAMIFGLEAKSQISAGPKLIQTCPGQTINLRLGISAGFGSGIGVDDRFSNVVNIGFNFTYFGATYNQVVISDNGFLTFDLTRANTGSSFTYATALGNGQLDKAIMFPFQDNLLNAAIINNLSTLTYGRPGSRVFVMQGCRVPYFSCTNVNSSSQIVLYEGTNIIDINIIDRSNACQTWNQGTGIVGIRNAPSEILVPGKNIQNVAWTDQNKTYRFTPDTSGSYTLDSLPYAPQRVIAFPDYNRVSWYAEGDTVNAIGTGANASVIADRNISYYVAKYNGDGLCFSTDTVTFYDTCFVEFKHFKGTTQVEVCAGSTYQFYEQLVFQTGKYYKNLISHEGCDSVLELNFIVNDIPVVDLNINGTIEICDGLSQKLRVTTYKSSESLQWYKDGVMIPGATESELEVFEDGFYKAIVTNPKNCTVESSTVNVIVRPKPEAIIESIAYGDVLCNYDTVNIIAKNVGPLHEFYWWPETAIRSYNTNIWGPSVKGVFRDAVTPMTLTVKNQYGCVSSTDFVVNTKPCCELYMPNAFTPNGDGNNDKFTPILKPYQNVIQFSIFDRYGKIVFETTTNSEGWDGTYPSGKEAGAGVYMYHMTYTCDDGQNYTQKDAITLIR